MLTEPAPVATYVSVCCSMFPCFELFSSSSQVANMKCYEQHPEFYDTRCPAVPGGTRRYPAAGSLEDPLCPGDVASCTVHAPLTLGNGTQAVTQPSTQRNTESACPSCLSLIKPTLSMFRDARTPMLSFAFG